KQRRPGRSARAGKASARAGNDTPPRWRRSCLKARTDYSYRRGILMCGIAGWVDFERDLTRERAAVMAMAQTMACRGPDGEGLWLARDRMGVKPLYYYPLPGGVLFGSEPKAILANPLADRAVDADGLRELLTVVKNPGQAVFAGMRELRPGHLLRVRRQGLVSR